MTISRELVAVLAMVAMAASVAAAKTVQVGPTRAYTTIQAGYNAAVAGDIIEIDSGTYTGSDGWLRIGKNNLTFRGVGPTRPVLDAAGGATASKGIFVLDQAGAGNLTVENLEFANAYIPSSLGQNAAGIRYQPTVFPAKLTARNCLFRDNQNGALTNAGATTDVEFDSCEFRHNGAGDGQSHNMYIGACRSFTLKHCYVRNAVNGHEVKTRAMNNYILYNRISNESGSAGRELQLANGGPSYVIGNIIYQGNGGNSQIITYGDEYSVGGANANPYLHIVNNTIVNQRSSGAQFIYVADAAATVLIQNNIFSKRSSGTQTVLTGPGTMVSNWETTNAGFADLAGLDFHLTAASTGAINMGTAPGTGLNSYPLTPVYQYVHPSGREDRPVSGTIDIGAYEYAVVNQAPTLSEGTDVDVYEGAAVSLHATASDPDNDPLTYTWSQTAGKGVSLGATNAADLNFAAPNVSTQAEAVLTLYVAVSDGKSPAVADAVNVRVWMLGDISRDNSVDVTDLLTFAEAWGSGSQDPNYDALCDFNEDDAVDVQDLLTLAENWTRTLE